MEKRTYGNVIHSLGFLNLRYDQGQLEGPGNMFLDSGGVLCLR